MDPTKRMARPAGDYLAKGSDPMSVPQARLHRETEQFMRSPGQLVPNNSMTERFVRQELAQDSQQVYSNPYGDWRGQNLPSTGVNYQLVKPSWQQGQLMAGTLEVDNDLGDHLQAEKVMGETLPNALQQPPNEWVTTAGLAAEVQRYPSSGQPVGLELPDTPLPDIEDLRFTQPLVEGSSADALFPQAEAPTFDLSKGKPARMPKAKG
jgi:hypothetical protein